MTGMKPGQKRVVIVGAGLAGAATAFQLVTRGITEVVILEKERLPGTHSSGRNAAMIRQVVGEAPIARMAQRSASALAEIGARSSGLRFDQNGSLLLGSRAHLERMLAGLTEAGLLLSDSRLLEKNELSLEVEALDRSSAEAAIWTANDGVIDVAGLLEYYLREARRGGAQLMTKTCLIDVVREGDRVTGVQTNTGFLPAEVVVNAAGPWVERVAEMAGARPIPFAPMRRHLYFTGPLDLVDPGWPFVWDVEADWYIRPESGGLLVCAGDESRVEPGEPDIDPAVSNMLVAKLSEHVPALGDIPLARAWAGIRTFSPDRNFVIGWDGKLEGFFWVAGLGGHGVTTSMEVGRMAARMISGRTDFEDRNFAPDRFEL